MALDGQLPLGFNVCHEGSPFVIKQRQGDGGLVVINVDMEMYDRRLRLYHPYNSREPWPPQCELDLPIDGYAIGDSIDVFRNAKTEELSQDFLDYLQAIEDRFKTEANE